MTVTGKISAVVLMIIAVVGCEPSSVELVDQSSPARATRIVTLAPHLTELVFTAGAGKQLVGVVEYSDYPEAARALPRIGDAFRIDYEAIARLSPDLILAWKSGTPIGVRERLEQLGYRVVALEPESLDDIAEHLTVIGEMAGTAAVAAPAADAYRARLDALRRSFSSASPISVFYQISAQPLFTIGGQHVISQALDVCGGRNIFSELEGSSPAVSFESVVAASPQAIVAGQNSASERFNVDPLEIWIGWSTIPAVRDQHMFIVDADQMHRSSTRILDGIDELCRKLATVSD